MRAREQFKRAYGISLPGRTHFELLLLLLCLEVVLAFSALGFIQVAPISVTTLSILVVVAAMYFGPLEGMALAAVFALGSMWKAGATSTEVGDLIFSPTHSGKPLESIAMALGVRLLFGLIAGFLFRWFFSKERKYRKLGIAVISVVTTAIHAALIYVCMELFFDASAVQTGEEFGESLLLNNLILYAVTVLVAIGCDCLMRNKTVIKFFAKTSDEDVRLSKGQKRTTSILTVTILLLCLFLGLHFVSRMARYLSMHSGTVDNEYLSWTYSLLLQLFVGIVATFGIIGVFFRWMQKYLSALTAEARREDDTKEELLRNYNRFFALEDDFESLYDVDLKTGHYECYVRGQFYQMNVLDQLVSTSDYFVDLKENINSVIYPEDREGLFAAMNRDAILKELTDKDHFDYFYRLMTATGPVWFKVRSVYKDAEKRHVIIGVFNASNDVETEQLVAQKTKLEESLTFTNFFLDTYVSAYYVNFDTLDCQVYKRTDELEQEYPIISNYFDSLSEYIQRDVHPDDRAMLLELAEPENMKEHLTREAQFTHIFRDISNGVEKIYRMQVIRGAEENRAAFGFIDITAETQRQMAQVKATEESNKLIESIAASYNVAFAVDMTDDSFRLLRMDDGTIGQNQHFDNFTEAKKYLLRYIPEADRKQMRAELDYKTIRRKLFGVKSYSVEYRVVVNQAILWHEMNVTRIDNEHIALGFAQRDLEITQRHLEDKRFSEYFALYEIDIDSGMMKVVKNSPYYDIDRSGTAMPFQPTMLRFAASLDGEAKEFFEQLSDLEFVKEQLATEDKHTYAYRSNNVGDKDWVECTSYVTLRHSDGTPAMFTFGFSRIDSLGIYRQELQFKYKQALEEATEEKRRNDILHDIIHSGKWSFFVNEKDEITRAEYSEEAMRIINNDFSTGITDWTEILHPEDREATLAAFMATVADHTCNTPYDVTYRMADRNGEYHWFHSAGRMVRNEDGTGEFFGIHIDISSQIEEQLEQHRELEAARNAADAASRSKSNFLFNMSHDIRTPMNAIRGFTTMVKKNAGDKEKVLEYLNKIDVSGDQLLRLINQVLEMARIESGKIEFEEKPVNVVDEFNSMITILSEQAKAGGQTFRHAMQDIVHRHVLADEARMGSITLNIVGNAMKYTPEGGHIDCELREIESRKPGYATFLFTVADDGIGMSEDYQKQLYEPFSREKSTTVSKIQGTGLGLAIVKNLVDLWGGEIKVVSELGKGTRFDITLDFKIDDQEGNCAEKETEFNAQSFAGKRILLVEDNEMNREIALDILGEYGFVVETAEDGDIAVAKVKEHFEKNEFSYYDFVLMDVQMPRMNGYEATKAIRALPTPAGVHVPIVAMTANAFAEDRQNALAAGMDDHAAKPIDIQKLLVILARFL